MESLPRQFGRYELLEHLATGGMAHIYRARLAAAEGTTKELVIKRVLPHLAQNREFIEMFIDEARITMPLNHGNIVQVFEFGQVDEDHFLAMEHVHGRNLETMLDRIEERALTVPVPVALFICIEVAKGLDFAHRSKDNHGRPTRIIHRDVSPGNILVGFAGQVKLTDFGIAKARSRLRQETAVGIIQGKACYLSPEQAECQELDARSDLFSLGIVLYEMLTGRRPFEGESEVETLDRVREARVEPPSQIRLEVLPELEGALLKALQLRRDRRYESLGEFELALTRCLHAIDPQFNASAMADWMNDLFAAELAAEASTPTGKQELVDRLAAEGVAVDGAGMTTGEVLALGTVAIPKARAGTAPPPLIHDRPERRPGLWALLVLALLLVLGGGGYLVSTQLGATVEPGGDPGGDGEPAGVATDRVDRQSEAGVGVVDAGTDVAGADAATGADAAAARADAGAAAGADTDPATTPEPVAPPGHVRRPPRVRYGTLTLHATPWAFVEIDGKRLKDETPIFNLKVRAGKHRVRFFNPELKREKTVPIRVLPGKLRSINVKLTP